MRPPLLQPEEAVGVCAPERERAQRARRRDGHRPCAVAGVQTFVVVRDEDGGDGRGVDSEGVQRWWREASHDLTLTRPIALPPTLRLNNKLKKGLVSW